MDVIVSLIRARFLEPMDHAPLQAVRKTKVQAIRAYTVPTIVGASERPHKGGWARSTGGNNASGAVNVFHVASTCSHMGMGRVGPPGAGGVGVAPAGDVLRQRAEAGTGCTQLQKEPYHIGCGKEGLRHEGQGYGCRGRNLGPSAARL